MRRERVVIVGGGFTGLAAARDLARSGANLKITLLERAPVTGGLAAGFPLCGTSLEKTYHYLFLSDRHMLELMRELGLEDRLIWGDSTVAVYLNGRAYPFTTALDVLRFSPCSFIGRLRLGLSALYLQKTKNWRSLVQVTALEWMRRVCGKSAAKTIWDPLLKAKFARYHDQVSMAWLWARIHARANSRTAGGEKLGYIRGGFATVANALENELRAAGVDVRCKADVERLVLGDGTRAIVVNGTRVPFDRCLFTGPSYALAKILPPDPVLDHYARQLQSIDYLGAVCLIFVSDQDIAGQFWVNIHEEGAPFLLFVQHSRLTGTALYQGKHVYYCGCYAPEESPLFTEAEEEIVHRWLDYVKKMFAQFERERVSELHVFRFRAAQHIVDADYEAKIPDYRTPLPGVYLANFSQIFPEDRGTNFAVRDGRKVARMILEDAAQYR